MFCNPSTVRQFQKLKISKLVVLSLFLLLTQEYPTELFYIPLPQPELYFLLKKKKKKKREGLLQVSCKSVIE